MADRSLPTFEYVNSRLSYDPDTGSFRWKQRPVLRPSHNQWNAAWAGKTAGSPDFQGYWRLTLRKQHHRATHVAWLLSYGRWPVGVIDHINGDPTDNRLSNLREATISQNTYNQKVNKNNRAGIKNVRKIDKNGPPWQARIAVNRKRYHLGYFHTQEQASAAYLKAAEELHGEFVRVENLYLPCRAKRRFTWRERRSIFLLTAGRCASCGCELEPGWHADHVEPWSKGGETNLTNGQPLCPMCNLKKGRNSDARLCLLAQAPTPCTVGALVIGMETKEK